MKASNALTPPITDADRAEARRIVDAAMASAPVPDPQKANEGRTAAAIFGDLAADRAEAEASEIRAGPDWFGRPAAREAALRQIEADALRRNADANLEPQGPLLAVMGEVIPARAPAEERPVTNQRAHLLNTLERPTTISVNASQRRLGLPRRTCGP